MVDQLCSYRIVVDLRMPGFVVSTSSSCCSVPHGQVSSFWWWWWWYWSSIGIVCPSQLIFCMEQSTFSPGHVHWANGRHRTFISSWRPGCSCRHSPCISSGMTHNMNKTKNILARYIFPFLKIVYWSYLGLHFWGTKRIGRNLDGWRDFVLILRFSVLKKTKTVFVDDLVETF